jgi:hypothetical protein
MPGYRIWLTFIDGDVTDKTTKVNELAQKIRTRKGLKPEVPPYGESSRAGRTRRPSSCPLLTCGRHLLRQALSIGRVPRGRFYCHIHLMTCVVFYQLFHLH